MNHSGSHRQHARGVLRMVLLLAMALAACSGPRRKRQTNLRDVQAHPQEFAEEPRRSFLDDFIDDEDRALDISDFLARDLGFLPIVIPITEPAVGYGLAGGLLFFHHKGKPKPGVPPTASAVIAGATENGTWFGGAVHQHTWKDGDIRYLGGVGYMSVNLGDFGSGTGDDTKLTPGLNFEGAFFLQDIRHRIGRSNWFLGMDYMFMNIDTSVDLGFPDLDPIRTATRSSGIGALVHYDTRDNTLTPGKGIDGLLGVRVYDDAIGSKNDYVRARGRFRTWIPFGERVVLGLRLDGDLASADTPLFDVPFVRLRGVPAFSYIGDKVITAEIEPRFKITERWGAVIFAGVGQTAGRISDLSGNDTVWAVGTGFRYMIARKMGFQAGIDVAYSDEEVAFYFTIGNAWLP